MKIVHNVRSQEKAEKEEEEKEQYLKTSEEISNGFEDQLKKLKSRLTKINTEKKRLRQMKKLCNNEIKNINKLTNDASFNIKTL